MAGAFDRRRDSPRGRGRQGIDRRAGCVRIRTFRNAGGARHRIWKTGEGAWRAALHSRTGSGRGERLHRWIGGDGDKGRRRRVTCHLRQRPNLSGGQKGLRLFSGDSMKAVIESYEFYVWVKAFHVIAVIAWMA